MQKIKHGTLAIDQGNVGLFSDFEKGGAMWCDHGSREARQHVQFSQPYIAPPSVTVGLSMWDMATDANSRVEIKAENVSETGFDLVFSTWSDTRIARARANWQSIGAVEDDDNWDV